jgi:hypothetical protein
MRRFTRVSQTHPVFSQQYRIGNLPVMFGFRNNPLANLYLPPTCPESKIRRQSTSDSISPGMTFVRSAE